VTSNDHDSNHQVGGSFCQKSVSHPLISSCMERIFRLILGISICKKHLYLCFLYFFFGWTNITAQHLVCPRLLSLVFDKKWLNLGPDFSSRQQSRQFFLQMLELPPYFLHFFFKICSWRIVEQIFPLLPPQIPQQNSPKAYIAAPPHGKDDPFDTHRHSTHQATIHTRWAPAIVIKCSYSYNPLNGP